MWLLVLIFSTLAVATGCNRISDTGLWQPSHGMIFEDVRVALGLRDYREIKKLNDDLPNFNINNIRNDMVYTVPYVEEISPPATWATVSCTPILMFSGAMETVGVSTPLSTPLAEATTSTHTPTTETTHPPKTEITHTPKSEFARTSSHETKVITSASTRSLPPQSQAVETVTVMPSIFSDELSEPRCYSRENEGITLEDTQAWVSELFCNAFEDEVLNTLSDPIARTYMEEEEQLYHFRVSWLRGCVVEEERGLEGCKDIMFENYKKCNNGGKGGYTDKGCLRFEYRPGVIFEAESLQTM
ncbi:uncharacterized protein F5Z01DRAFT_353506 [Emericellopsis atlantica]|uniref:Uncharacterized protein n=1 Tax=Emericellopsis atlantica TaxID=2614577 RepID=A0A9P8CKK0_9HYPO|nr:uncharacterized protein F5Z01DRAFT_353506 [Emericellopsis atlantica]KAG9250649.1 hypothetical protein F5Z01DRAFT_353506 [Emericellopsis atlantica]